MPIFETDEERTYFLSTILIHPAFLASKDDKNEHRNEHKNEHRNEHRNDNTGISLTEHEQLVLTAIRMDATITIIKMAELLGISKSTVSRATQSLQDKHVIGREGSRKSGKWIIL